MLIFARRPRRQQTDVADRKIWASGCGQYRVVYSRCRFGVAANRAISNVYYAQHFDAAAHTWDVLSKHRTRRAAMKACEQHNRN